VASGHFSDIVQLSSGHWRFDVHTRFGPSRVSFTVNQTVP
jgi:hypothetical protein